MCWMQTVYKIKNARLSFENFGFIYKKSHRGIATTFKPTVLRNSVSLPCHKQVRIWRRELGPNSKTHFLHLIQLLIFKIIILQNKACKIAETVA